MKQWRDIDLRNCKLKLSALKYRASNRLKYRSGLGSGGLSPVQVFRPLISQV